MAKVNKKKQELDHFSPEKPSIKTKEFILKRSVNGRAAGEKIIVGPIGEKFYKQLNII